MQAMVADTLFIERVAGAAVGRGLDTGRAIKVIIGIMKGLWNGDARLLEAILAGDTRAWQKFILQYSNFIYRAIIPYTDDYDEKMAVYLHVLEKLRQDRFARLRAFAYKAKLSTWLTVVARRLAIDYLRGQHGRDFARKRIRVVSIDGEPDYTKILADLRTPEAEMAAGESREQRRILIHGLLRALEKLEDRERLAVQMVYFQGMRINVVGRLLRLPAAYKFLSAALKKMRTEMELSSRLSRGEISSLLQGETHE